MGKIERKKRETDRDRGGELQPAVIVSVSPDQPLQVCEGLIQCRARGTHGFQSTVSFGR